MKRKIIMTKFAAVILFVFLAMTTALSAPSFTLVPSTLPSPGGTFTVALVLDGTQVGNWQALIDYDRDVLTYQSYTYNAPYNVGVTAAYEYPTSSGNYHLKFGLVYFGGSPGYTYSNQTVVTITFLYNGGNTDFTYYSMNAGSTAHDSYVKTYPTNTVNTGTTWTGASISGPYADITSVAAGGTWATAATWDLNHVPNHSNGTVIINSTTNPVTVSANTTWPHDVRINAGGMLTNNTGITFAVTGNFTIKSDATATGSYIDNGTTTVGGTTSVERYMTGNWDGLWPTTQITWHMVSSPVSGGTINSFLGGLLNYWNEPSYTWTPLTLPVTTPLTVNKGYLAAMTSNGVITYTGGTLNTGNQSITGLTSLHAVDSTGFNLIGNAYPSAVKWDGSVSRTNVDAAAYIWNGTGWDTHLTTDATPYQIPAEQGFEVHVTTGHSTGSLTIPNANRVHPAGTYVKSASYEELSLKINGNNMQDVTSVRFNSEATEGFDSEYDAYKLWSWVNACPQIYSIIPTDNLSINSISELTTQTVVPVGIRVGATDTYTITASGIESFPEGTEVYLEDLLLNKTQNLVTNPVYTFDASAGNATQRFNLHFAPTTGIPNVTETNLKIYSYDNTVFVNIPYEMNGSIIVYDLLGQTVTQKPIASKSLNKISLNATSGYYLVKVLGDKATVSGKVFIR